MDTRPRRQKRTMGGLKATLRQNHERNASDYSAPYIILKWGGSPNDAEKAAPNDSRGTKRLPHFRQGSRAIYILKGKDD